MSRFLGPLAGLAAGLGIAALLSHFGLGEGMASFLMIALLVFAAIFVVRLLMRKREPQPAMQYAGAASRRKRPRQLHAGRVAIRSQPGRSRRW
jgi:predicted lipid-binding transport protein (Tim44 family)